MADEDLDALLSRMEAIAKAANAFTSEAVQHEAFSALIAAFDGKRRDAPRQVGTPPPLESSQAKQPAGESLSRAGGSRTAARTKRSSSGSRSEWKMVKDLDLNPHNKQSFAEFANEKNP
jgi:hypothetical protein